jgi:hypothetical protein
LFFRRGFFGQAETIAVLANTKHLPLRPQMLLTNMIFQDGVGIASDRRNYVFDGHPFNWCLFSW